MNDNRKKLAIIATRAEENPDMATLPFVVGSAALSMDVEAVVILQSSGVFLAMKGYVEHVHAAGFPPLKDLLETFFEAGGKLLACSPCLQARNIDPEDLIEKSTVIAGATLVAEILESSNVVTY